MIISITKTSAIKKRASLERTPGKGFRLAYRVMVTRFGAVVGSGAEDDVRRGGGEIFAKGRHFGGHEKLHGCGCFGEYP